MLSMRANWRSEMIGEYPLASSQVGPGAISPKRARILSATASRNRLVQQQARARDADLPGIGKYAARDTVGSEFEIGIVEDELRALAAQFERHRLDAAARNIGHDRGAGGGRAGEGHLADAGMPGHRVSGRAAVPEDDVDQAFRQPCPHRELGEHERRIGRHFRRLQHDRISRCERRTELPARHGHREIPRA